MYADTRNGKTHIVALNIGQTYKMECGMERTRTELSRVYETLGSSMPDDLVCSKCRAERKTPV